METRTGDARARALQVVSTAPFPHPLSPPASLTPLSLSPSLLPHRPQGVNLQPGLVYVGPMGANVQPQGVNIQPSGLTVMPAG